jgi:hypothetical protein
LDGVDHDAAAAPRRSSIENEAHVAGGKSAHSPSRQAALRGGEGHGGWKTTHPWDAKSAHTPSSTPLIATWIVCAPSTETTWFRQVLVHTLLPDAITQSASVAHDKSAEANAAKTSLDAASVCSSHVPPASQPAANAPARIAPPRTTRGIVIRSRPPGASTADEDPVLLA